MLVPNLTTIEIEKGAVSTNAAYRLAAKAADET
jgi:hypothetical protein